MNKHYQIEETTNTKRFFTVYGKPVDKWKTDVPIGYLMTSGIFACNICIGAINRFPYDYSAILNCKVFLVNILPYSQKCHICNRIIVDGIRSSFHLNDHGIGVPLEAFEITRS